MPTVRQTGGREELDAAWTQINALIADYTAGRASILGTIRRTGTALLRRLPLAAVLADLTAVRAEVVKLVTDFASGYKRLDNGLMARSPLAALIADDAAVRAEVVKLVTDLTALLVRFNAQAYGTPNIADGTTAGKIKSQATVPYSIAGTLYTKGATDDLWDLSAEVDTDGTHYRAYWLYLDSGGTATIGAGADALTSAANAIAALPSPTASKCAVGVYVAGPSTDFNGVAGLAAQGTLINGWPATLAKTAVAPAAATATTSIGIADGTTAGCLRTVADTEYAVDGEAYAKAATDDLWDLSAETDTGAGEFRAYWLYLNAAGTASIAAGTVAASAALAIAALPALAADKAAVGVYVAGESTDFDGVAGLTAQGRVYNGYPVELAGTASAPAALTTAATAGITDGGTAGYLRTRAEYEFMIGGRVYTKAATDDLWNLSGETDTGAAEYKAFWLYLDSSGTATIGAGTAAASSALALAALPTETSTKCPVGVYVAGPSTDFDGVAGLAAQGTIIDGRPAALTDTASATSETATLIHA